MNIFPDLPSQSMDWHPADHVSFHSNHADAVPFTLKRIRVRGMDLDQMMWNPHCVQHSQGAELSKDLKLPMGTVLVHKGTDSHVDSYSAFGDDTGGTLEKTELETNLRERGVDRLYVCGLALDYCVHFTAMDAVKAGFQASVILPACRAIAMESADKAILDMRALNVELLE